MAHAREPGIPEPPAAARPVRPSAWSRTVPLLAMAAAFGGAILLAPALHALLSRGGLPLPFSRVFRYLLLALLMTALCVTLRPWNDIPPDLYGLRGPNARPRLALYGAATAIALLVALAGIDALAGNLAWDRVRGPGLVRHRLFQAIGRGIVLGLAEEFFFRGWFFGRLRRRSGDVRAAVVVALVFGAIHAFRESDAPRHAAASSLGALRILGSWAGNLVDWEDFGPSCLSLALLSLLLTGAFLRWRTLWFGVGLHGAAVAWLPLHSAATMRSVERDWLGSKWLYDGVPGWVLLSLLAWFVWPRRTPTSPSAPAPA